MLDDTWDQLADSPCPAQLQITLPLQVEDL